MKFLTRLRFGPSQLNSRRFSHNYWNCINPLSSCSLEVESLFHFLLNNNYFTNICSTLLDELEKTDSNILNFQTIKLWKYFFAIVLNMMWIKIMIFSYYHCVKSVRIQSFSVPYSVQMRETANQKNSEYGHLSRSVLYLFYFKSMQWKVGKHNQSKSTPSTSSPPLHPLPLYIVANDKTTNSMK